MENELNVAGPMCMSPHSMRHKQPMTSMREGVWCMVDETGEGRNYNSCWILPVVSALLSCWDDDCNGGSFAVDRR